MIPLPFAIAPAYVDTLSGKNLRMNKVKTVWCLFASFVRVLLCKFFCSCFVVFFSRGGLGGIMKKVHSYVMIKVWALCLSFCVRAA